MYINTFKYRPEDVACVLCAEYVKKLGCTALSCPCLAERMEAGVVGYAEAVAELFPLHPRLTPRILRLVAGFPGSLWQDEQHKRRFAYLRTLLGYRDCPDTVPCILQPFGWRNCSGRRPSVCPVSSSAGGTQPQKCARPPKNAGRYGGKLH